MKIYTITVPQQMIQVDEWDQLQIIRSWCKEKPDVVKKLLKNPKGTCPFPKECRNFPCKDLSCNADEILDGFAFRRS